MVAARFVPILPVALIALLFSGCGYVHFGRYEAPLTASDSMVSAENSSLRVEKKMLQQELELARKEGAALRSALENRYSDNGSGQPELVARLNETTRELAALRASYAKLETERRRAPAGGASTPAHDADLQARLGETEEKLAAAMLTYTRLQQETNFLRTEVSRVRGENARLTRQVGELTSQNEQAVAALSQLNSELLAQREARNRAEQETRTVRAQLQMLVSRGPRTDATTLADARAGSAVEADEMNASVRMEQPNPAPVLPSPMLRTSPERLRAAAASLAAEGGPRYHFVAEGDTLETIAVKYYGKPERWRMIYAVNNSLLRDGRPLVPGMKLEIPSE